MKSSEWLPMDTAPRDREIVARFGGVPYRVRWQAPFGLPDRGYWRFVESDAFDVGVYDNPVSARGGRRFTGWRELTSRERSRGLPRASERLRLSPR